MLARRIRILLQVIEIANASIFCTRPYWLVKSSMLVTGFLSWESIPLYGAQRTRQTSPMQRAPHERKSKDDCHSNKHAPPKKTAPAQRTRADRHTELFVANAVRKPVATRVSWNFLRLRNRRKYQKSDMWKPFFMFMLVV